MKFFIDTANIDEIKEAGPQVLVTMGAGDIGLQAQPIENALSHAS